MKSSHIKAFLATLLLVAGFSKASASIDPTAQNASPTEQSSGAIPCLACWDDSGPE